jgi:surface antigen
MFSKISKKRSIIASVCLALAIISAGAVLLSGCATGIGAAAGAAIGALGDTNNRYRGAVNGAAIGGVAGLLVDGTKYYLEKKAAEKAAMTGQTVTYHNESGAVVTATPGQQSASTNCRKITTTTTVNGNSSTKIEEVCEGRKQNNNY